jgi:hypothetical protein
MRRAAPKLLAVVTLVFMLSACGAGSGAPATDGPLSSGATVNSIPRGEICAPGGERQTFGDQIFTNYGHATVVLDRVVLLHPHNERLFASYAVPGALLIGTAPWPPSYKGIPYTWKHRQPVPGFKLAPGKSFNMVLGLAAIAKGEEATSQGMLVYYHDPAGSYVARNDYANVIAATKTGCETQTAALPAGRPDSRGRMASWA